MTDAKNTTKKKVELLENKLRQLEALVDRFIPVDEEGEYTQEFKDKVEKAWQQKEAGKLQPLD